MRPTPSIVFTGGGTAGHLFAGLAVAEALRESRLDERIVFAGGGRPWERREVRSAGHEYESVPCCAWPGWGGQSLLWTHRAWRVGRFLAMNSAGFLQARRLLRRHHAAAVVGLGGYASAPVARAAVSLRVPLILLEQNAVPGRVTRWLGRQAARVCTSFEPNRALLTANVERTGNPVRRSFLGHLGQDPPAERDRLLLITGGSLGAGPLNAAVPEALAKIKPLIAGWRIVHQTGERDAAATRDRYRQLGVPAEVTPFADLPSLLPRTGLSISRAGGSTLAELAHCGVPALVCPYPQASEDHQRKNAAALGDACRFVEQESPDLAGRLASELAELLADGELRRSLSARILAHARPNAAERVARLVRDLAIPARAATVPGSRSGR